MTTYKTGNPLGSTSVKDLYDNAENLDEAVNTRSAESWDDRFGVARKTWWGMEQDFQQFLINSGYENIGDYGPGLEITARNQIFWRDGELYRAGASLELPYTTTGDWGEEKGLFVAVGDQALRQELADPEKGAAMVGFKASIASSDNRTVANKLSESLSLDDFRYQGDLDDTLAFQRAVNTGRHFTLPGREIVLSETVDAGPNGLMFSGDDGAVIRFAEGFDGRYGIVSSGSLQSLPSINSTVNIGMTTLVFSEPHGLKSGDIIVSWLDVEGSFNAARIYYKSGQMFQVAKVVNSTTIVTTVPTFEAQTSDYSFFKINSAPVSIKNVTMIGNVELGLLRTSLSIHPDVENCSFVNTGGDACFYLDRCFGGSISNCNTNNEGGIHGDYGLVIGNCQSLKVFGGVYHSRRHGIVHGGSADEGSVSCRDCYTFGAHVSNERDSLVEAFNFHGNSENCYAIGCTIEGGITLAGSDTGAINCRITNSGHGVIVKASEVRGGSLTLQGCKLVSSRIDPFTYGQCYLSFGFSSSLGITTSTKLPLHVSVLNCETDIVDSGATTTIFGLDNSGSDQRIQVTIDNFHAKVNNIGQFANIRKTIGNIANNASSISITNISGTIPPGRPLLSGNYGTTELVKLRLPRLSGKENLALNLGETQSPTVENTFRYAYPRTPVVLATMVGVGAVGNVPSLPVVVSLTNKGFNARAISSTGAEWESNVTGTYCWSATLDEL